jgi:hypothetical protein
VPAEPLDPPHIASSDVERVRDRRVPESMGAHLPEARRFRPACHQSRDRVPGKPLTLTRPVEVPEQRPSVSARQLPKLGRRVIHV